MGVSFGEAWSIEATRRACSYKSAPLPYSPPDWLGWSQEDWDSCAPGGRAAMIRGRDWYTGEPIAPAQAPPQEPTLAEKREAARIAAKERL